MRPTAPLIAVLLVLTYAPAAHADAPRVTGARLYAGGGFLLSDIRSSGLFSEEIEGTVRSGLPAVVELIFSLDTADDDAVQRGAFAWELRYDVWDDRYMIRDVDTTSVFPSFDDMSNAVTNLQDVRIAPLDILRAGEDYLVRFSIRVQPLRGRDERAIAGWVGDTVRQGDSGRQQMLNINDLIEHFFARENDESRRVRWFSTPRFRTDGLPREGGDR